MTLDAPHLFWLTFNDDKRPPGDQFLGVCIVEVSAAEAARAEGLLTARYGAHQRPEGAAWIAAAIRRAWATHCNPGGTVTTLDITENRNVPELPHHRLLTRDALKALGIVVDEDDGGPHVVN
jgi:hypothetical protein